MATFKLNKPKEVSHEQNELHPEKQEQKPIPAPKPINEPVENTEQTSQTEEFNISSIPVPPIISDNTNSKQTTTSSKKESKPKTNKNNRRLKIPIIIAGIASVAVMGVLGFGFYSQANRNSALDEIKNKVDETYASFVEIKDDNSYDDPTKINTFVSVNTDLQQSAVDTWKALKGYKDEVNNAPFSLFPTNDATLLNEIDADQKDCKDVILDTYKTEVGTKVGNSLVRSHSSVVSREGLFSDEETNKIGDIARKVYDGEMTDQDEVNKAFDELK